MADKKKLDPIDYMRISIEYRLCGKQPCLRQW